MLDINSFTKAQKAIWVKRFNTNDKASWKAIPNFYYNWLLGPDTWKCNLSCKEKENKFPKLYWKILRCWCEIKQLNNSIKITIEIRRECLWFNMNIKVNKKEVSWHEHGINIIHVIIYLAHLLLSYYDYIANRQSNNRIDCLFLAESSNLIGCISFPCSLGN
jgi:hypothetical protein